MDPILATARRHGLAVIEDCAHALGATYCGKPVGTLGDAALFSFQTLKPLNCYGGGMALVADAAVAARVRQLAEREPWPDQKRVDAAGTNANTVGSFTDPRNAAPAERKKKLDDDDWTAPATPASTR